MSKGTSESAKNFKNISLTVSVRQQMRMASVYYNEMFEPVLKLPENVKTKAAIVEDSVFSSNLRSLMDEDDIVCAEVDLKCQKYQSGDILVLDAFDRDSLKVGVIQTILVRGSEVYFVVIRYSAKRHKLGYFVTEDVDDQESCVCKASRIADYKPLIMHGTLTKFKFALHHYVSVSHSSNPV